MPTNNIRAFSALLLAVGNTLSVAERLNVLFITAAPGISEKQHGFRSRVAHRDATIRALLAKLHQPGIRDNMLVLFTSDNGGAHETDNRPLWLDLPADVGETSNLLEVHPNITAKRAGEIRNFRSSPRDRSGFPTEPAASPGTQPAQSKP